MQYIHKNCGTDLLTKSQFHLSGLFCGIYLLFLQWGGNTAVIQFSRVNSDFTLTKTKLIFRSSPSCTQVQAEVKKAWLRRNLTLDLKQKARITSSGGGGSCYYGGMMSHTTTHSVSLSAANPRALSFAGGVVGSGGPAGGGSGVRPPRHGSLHPQTSLPGYVPCDTQTSSPQQELAVWKAGGTECGVFARHARASRGINDSRSQGAFPQTSGEDPDSYLSLKELETIL